MRSRTLIPGWSLCRVSGSSSKRIRVVIALAAAMCCLGWLSSVAVAQFVCDEESTYCRDVNLRCTYSGQGQNCCVYTCAPDDSCTAAEQQPMVECAPPDVKISFTVYSGAPGCTVPEGQARVTNLTSLYWYKLNFVTTADSQIWNCSACQRTFEDLLTPLAPAGQAGYTLDHTVVFPSPSECTCSPYAEGGCCDNCPYEYRNEEDCVNKHCNPAAGHEGQVCASMSSTVEVVSWSEDGTTYKAFSPHRWPTGLFTSACIDNQ